MSILDLDLWGTDEIGAFTGRKKSAVSVLVNQPGVPGPCMGSRRCRRWFKDSVIEYLRAQERANSARSRSMSEARRSFRASSRV